MDYASPESKDDRDEGKESKDGYDGDFHDPVGIACGAFCHDVFRVYDSNAKCKSGEKLTALKGNAAWEMKEGGRREKMLGEKTRVPSRIRDRCEDEL